MWPPTITDCECGQPGWCARHQCHKDALRHRQCRRQPGIFARWERGEGPGQPPPNSSTEETSGTPEMPGLMKRGMNFAQASVRHMADGMNQATEVVFEQRLAICRECELCETTMMICRHPKCGCYLQIKASWRSQACPLGKWPAIETDETETSEPHDS